MEKRLNRMRKDILLLKGIKSPGNISDFNRKLRQDSIKCLKAMAWLLWIEDNLREKEALC